MAARSFASFFRASASAFVAWLIFNRNDTNLGGTNGLTDFKQVIGYRLSEPGTQRVLYIITVLCLGASYFLCQWIIRSRAGRVLVAVSSPLHAPDFT